MHGVWTYCRPSGSILAEHECEVNCIDGNSKDYRISVVRYWCTRLLRLVNTFLF
jgi:hypothetical protein